jgi:multiple sugar transport system permease protein
VGLIGPLTANTLSGMARRKALLGYLFLLPTMLGIFIFTAGPVIVSFGLSLCEWNVIKPPVFIGTENYQQLFSDGRVLTSFGNTFTFVIFAVTVQLVLGFLLALGVQQRMKWELRYFFRSAFFLPLLTSAASISIVIAYMFHTEFGVINYYLGFLGIPRIPWLTSSDWVMVTIVLTYVWQQVGFTFILFLGGLSNIPTDILEAADIDGAGGWRRLWHITLPLLSPTILFAAVVGVIGALQVFEQPFVMSRGGPGDASRTAVMIIYESAFQNLQIGYGSALAVLLFVIILLITGFQFWLSKRWVFYQ